MTERVADEHADKGAPAAPLGQAPMVMLLLALNIIVFAVQVLAGVNWLQPAGPDLIAWGGNLASYTLTGQPWRLLTSMFLHVGIIHLVLNMYMLAGLGPYVERAFGHMRFLLVYLVSGLCGSIASALWHAHHRIDSSTTNAAGQVLESSHLQLMISAGASGALMGISGAFLGRMLVYGVHAQDRDAVGLKGPLAQTIAINLMIGFLIPGLDDAAHLGGLAGGFLLGAILTIFNFPYSRAKRMVAALTVSAAALVLIYAAARQEPSQELLALKAITANTIARMPAATR